MARRKRLNSVKGSPHRWRVWSLALREAGRAAGDALRGFGRPFGRAARPQRLLFAPQDLRTADPIRADDIYAGSFRFAGLTVETGGLSPFSVEPPDERWSEALHGFGWLRHLRAADTALARENARALVGDAVGRRRRAQLGRGPARRTPVVARRLLSLLCQSPLVLGGAEHELYTDVLREIGRCVSQLERDLRVARRPGDRLAAAVALSYASLCCAGLETRLKRATRLLTEELDRQIGADGGHLSRHPGALVEILLDLLPLRLLYASRGIDAPDALNRAVDRAAPALRGLRHGGGEIALMNGMGRTPVDHVATLLSYDETRGRPPPSGGPSGYHRLARGSALVLLDGGAPPPLASSSSAAAGCLSFEFSDGPHRIVVNAGWPARHTGAHSTLQMGDASSGAFLHDLSGPVPRFLRRRLGSVMLAGPRAVDASRDDGSDGAAAVLGRHDGFLRAFGVTHERRVALDGDGTLLAGRDTLILAAGRAAPAVDAAIRFHLHPAVAVGPGPGGSSVRLVLPDGTGWLFTAEGGTLAVADSTFNGGTAGPRPTRQLVVRARPDEAVEWSFRREP